MFIPYAIVRSHNCTRIRHFFLLTVLVGRSGGECYCDPVLTRTTLQISWTTCMAKSGRTWLTGSCKWSENQVGFGNVGSRSRARDCVIAWRSRRASILGHRDLLQKEVLTRTGVHKERACQKPACYMVFEEYSVAVLSMLIEFGSKTAFN